MATVSDLSVKISAQTADFTAGVRRAESQLGDLASEAIQTATSLEVLSNRSNDAEGEVRELGRGALSASGRVTALGGSASSTATTLTGLSAAASLAGASFSSLANTPLLIALPALTAGATALLSTLFPLAAVVGTLTAGAGALAAAFGAVVGSGLLAFGEQRGEQAQRRLNDINAQIARLEALQETEEGLTGQQEQRLENLQEEADTLEEQTGIMGGLQAAMSDLGDELAPLITEFGEAFIPLIEDAIDGLPDLVEDVLDAAGGLEVFQETLRDLGESAADALPGIVSGLVDVAEEALPHFIDLIQWLSRNGESIFRGMLRVTRRLAPTLLDFGRAFARVTPELTRLGTFVLETLIPAFTGFLETTQDIVNVGAESNGLVDFLSRLTQDALAWVQNSGMPMFNRIASTITDGLITAVTPEDEGGSGLIDALGSWIGTALTRFEAWLAKGDNTLFANFAGEFAGALSSALENISEDDIAGGVEAFSGILGSLVDEVITVLNDDEVQALNQQLWRLASNIGSEFIEQFSNYLFSPAFVMDVAGLISSGIATAISTLTGIGVGAIESSLFNPARQQSAIQLATRESSPGGQAITSREGQQIANRTDLTVTVNGKLRDEDGEIVAVIEDQAQSVVDEEQRRTRMNQGRSMNPQ